MALSGAIRDPARWAAVLVAAAAIGSIGAMAASRALIPTESAVIPTETWPWTATGVGVEPLVADSPFRSGDVVVAVEGRPMADWAAEAVAPPWLLGYRSLGVSMDTEVERDGQAIAFAAPLEPFPIARLGGAPLGLVAFATGAMLLALVLVARRPRAVVLRLIVLAVVCDVADIVAWELDLQPSDVVAKTPFLYAFGVASLLGLLFWAVLVHVLTIYPMRARWLTREPRAIALVYAVPLGAFALGAVVAALAGGGPLAWIGRLGPLLGAVVSAETVILLVAIAAGYRRTPAPRRPQVRLVAITLGIAATASLALISLPIALSLPPLAPRGVVALLALPVIAALAFAVVRDRLFQVDLLVTSRARIVAAREEERLRLRRELHDGLGPTLAALGLKVDAARAAAASDEAGSIVPALDEIRGDVRSILAEVRGMARGLRPPALDTLGLVEALRQQVEALSAGSGTTVVVLADDATAARTRDLPPGVEVAAYRIVVEAVTNLVRHAGATTGSVRLIIDGDMLRIEVVDDGTGVDDDAAGGVGTRSMYERAAEVGGELTIEPGLDDGTVLTASLPVGPT